MDELKQRKFNKIRSQYIEHWLGKQYIYLSDEEIDKELEEAYFVKEVNQPQLKLVK